MTKFTGVIQLYKVVVDNYKLEKENEQIRQNESMYTISDLRKLIQDQCTKFPISSEFDYRTPVTDGVLDEQKVEAFFNPELLKLMT